MDSSCNASLAALEHACLVLPQTYLVVFDVKNNTKVQELRTIFAGIGHNYKLISPRNARSCNKDDETGASSVALNLG